MKVKVGAFVAGISGKLGGQTFQNTASGTFMKGVGSYSKVRSTSQTNQRLKTQLIMGLWSKITADERALWELASLNYSKIDRFGSIKKFNGFQIFSRINQARSLLNQSLLSSPLPFHLAEYPTMVNVESDANSLVIQSNAYANDTIVVIYATPSLPYGVSQAKKYLRYIGSVTGLELFDSIDIMAMYQSVFGNVSDGQKIYLGIQTVSPTSFYTNGILIQNEPAIIIGENPPPAFDPDAQAFIDAVGTLTEAQQIAINNLVLGLKSIGVWLKCIAIYPVIGGTASAHKWNLKNPVDSDAAFRIAFSGGITHNANGMQGNGTTGFGNIFIVPSTSLSINNTHLSFYSGDDNAYAGGDMGSTNSAFTQALIMEMRFTDNNDYGAVNSSAFPGQAYGSALGFYILSRVSSTQFVRYKSNGTFTVNRNSVVLPSQEMRILGLSPPANEFSGRLCKFASIGEGLTPTEAANYRQVVQDYQTELGRAD